MWKSTKCIHFCFLLDFFSKKKSKSIPRLSKVNWEIDSCVFFTHSCAAILLLWGDTMNKATLIKRLKKKHLIWNSLFQKIVESVTITVGRRQAGRAGTVTEKLISWSSDSRWPQETGPGWATEASKPIPNDKPPSTSPHSRTLSKQIHKVEQRSETYKSVGTEEPRCCEALPSLYTVKETQRAERASFPI